MIGVSSMVTAMPNPPVTVNHTSLTSGSGDEQPVPLLVAKAVEASRGVQLPGWCSVNGVAPKASLLSGAAVAQSVNVPEIYAKTFTK